MRFVDKMGRSGSLYYLILGTVTAVHSVSSCEYGNSTLEPALRHLCDFSNKHPKPIGVLTTTAGREVDLRETITVNSDTFSNELLLDTMLHLDAERIPERVVHAKGTAAMGYFQVTHDISKYTMADVFNGIGKKTPVVGRFSTAVQSLGGPDVSKELKGLALKFYTKEGNLDLLCLQTAVYFYRDPLYFNSLVHAFKRNPGTNTFDFTAQWDFLVKRPQALNAYFWIESDFGVPRSYRHMDAFPVHTYQINNKKGEKFYVRFNFRTEQGLQSLTPEEVIAVSRDLDYYVKDLYNSIANHTFPSWRLEMDVLTYSEIKHLDYDPFDVTRLWKNCTYHTVQVGKLVLNRNPDNYFKVSELSAFNPASLVPGIPGPVDFVFKGRKLFYRDTQNYRLGINHGKEEVNRPVYAKTYTRDGVSPVLDNMRDAPNYYPNSFNGPEPVVDSSRPYQRLLVVENTAVDLEPAAYFYNHVLVTEGERQRLADSLAETLAMTVEHTRKKAIAMLSLISKDLARRVTIALKKNIP